MAQRSVTYIAGVIRTSLTLAGDALCSVQVYLVAPARQAHASLFQITQAAELIYDVCVAGDAHLGGFAVNIGEVWESTKKKYGENPL